MSNAPKISKMTIYGDGTPKALQEWDETKSELHAASVRWNHLKQELSGKPWSACPPEVTSDFVLGAARDLLHQYGPQGSLQMATLMVTSGMFKRFPESLHLELKATTTNGPQHIDLLLMDVPETPENEDHEDTLEIVATLDSSSDFPSLDEPEKLLHHILHTPQERSRRKPFDPLAPGALSIQDVASLAASAENVLKKGDLDILMAAAMALLAWRQAEINKADSVSLTVNGVTNGEVEVYPGRKIFMEANVLLHDADLRAAHHDIKPGDETTISITHRKPRN